MEWYLVIKLGDFEWEIFLYKGAYPKRFGIIYHKKVPVGLVKLLKHNYSNNLFAIKTPNTPIKSPIKIALVFVDAIINLILFFEYKNFRGYFLIIPQRQLSINL